MNWDIYFKTEDQHHRLYTLKNMTKEQIQEHLKNKFKDEIANNLDVKMEEYPDEPNGGLPYSVEYYLAHNDYYIYGFHAFQIEEDE